MSQFKKGALLSYASIFVTNITGLLLTPYIISSLGNSEYGVYVLVGSIISYLVVLDFGLNNAVVKYITKYRLKNEKVKEENLLAHIGITYLFLAFLASILGLLLVNNFNLIFDKSLTPKELELANTLIPFVLINILVILPASVFVAYCHAYDKYVYPKAINLLKTVFRSLLVFLFLYFGYKALAIVIIDSVFNLLVTLGLILFSYKKLKFKLKLYKLDFQLWREILYYSAWIFLASIILKLQWQGGQAIVGRQLGAVAVAIFGVGVMLGGYYNAFAFAINSMVLPRAVNLVEEGKNGVEITEDMIKIARYILFVLLLVSSGFFLFGKIFIKLWLDETYLPSWDVALCIMIVLTIPLTQIYGNSILEAKSRNRFKSLLSLITVSVAAILAYFLSPLYGLKAVYLPILGAMLIDALFLNLYYVKVFDFNVLIFLKRTILHFGFWISILVIVCNIFLYYLSLTSWVHLLTAIAIYGTLYIVLVYRIVLNEDEKNTLKKIFIK